jgi:hypothetical protein
MQCGAGWAEYPLKWWAHSYVAQQSDRVPRGPLPAPVWAILSRSLGLIGLRHGSLGDAAPAPRAPDGAQIRESLSRRRRVEVLPL